MRRSTQNGYALALYAVDMFAVLLSLLWAQWLRQALPYGLPFVVTGGGLNVAVSVMALVTWTVSFRQLRAYDPNRVLHVAIEVQTVLLAVGVAMVLLAGLLYFTYRGLSRLLFAYFFLLDLLLTVFFRLALRTLLNRLGARRVALQRVLLVGAGDVGSQMARVLEQRHWMGLELVGFVDDDPAKSNQPVASYPILGTLDDAPALVKKHSIDEVIIALPSYAYQRLERLVSVLNEMPVNVRVVPDLIPLAYLRTTVGVLGDMPLITLKEPVLSGSARLVKRTLDLVVAALALALIWPLLLLIALWIKLDSPGPAVFAQKRTGWLGELFTMYKFRTMCAGAENEIDVIMERDAGGQRFLRKSSLDPRITRAGQSLRRWSLDELPQLFNVLKGEMSLVGPRPDLPVLAQDYQPWQRKRYSVPPGITGWWQVTGRSDRPSVLHVEEDLYYIRNYSFLLDLRILISTVGAVIRGKGAY